MFEKPMCSDGENQINNTDQMEAGEDDSMASDGDKGGKMWACFVHLERSLYVLGLLTDWPVRWSSPVSVCRALYHAAVWGIGWGAVVAKCAGYHYGASRRGEITYGISLALLATVHFVSLAVAMTIIVSFLFSRNRTQLFSAWCDYKELYSSSCTWVGSLRRAVTACTVCCWVGALAFIVLFIIFPYTLNSHDFDFFQNHAVFAHFKDIPQNVSAHVYVMFHHVFYEIHNCATVFLFLGLLVIMVREITKDFRELNDTFGRQAAASTDICAIVHTFYKRHQCLSQLVLRLDDIFSTLVLAVFMCGIAIICLTVFIAISQPPNYSTQWLLFITIPTLVLYTAVMVLVSFYGTRLSDTAKGCQRILYDLNFKHLVSHGDNVSLEYLSFLMRLNSAPIGITAWKLFYINRNSIKMMVMMIITYTVVLLKLAPVSASNFTSNSPNCTAS